jgi:hypothetical protein
MRRISSLVALIACTSLLVTGCGSPFYMGQQPSTQYRKVGPRTVSGDIAAVRSVAVSPGTDRPILDIRGDYLRSTPTAGEAAASSVGEATGEIFGEMMMEDPRVILLAPVILPLVAIFAAASARVQQQIQEFRDELTADLAEEIDRPSPNIELASVLHTNMHRVPHVESTLLTADEPVPDNVDAILLIKLSDLDINVQGDNATFRTTAVATLTDREHGGVLFRRSYEYSVHDDIGRWARNDNELLRDYGVGARQYFARQVSDEFFGKVYLRHVLRPVKPGSKGVLGWELVLLGENAESAWANEIKESDARYDLEVFDGSQLVYSAYDIEGTSHEIQEELEPCTSYRWTVRPIYFFEGTARAGEWLAHDSATRRMYTSLDAANYQGTGAAQQLEVREITEGYPQFKTGC